MAAVRESIWKEAEYSCATGFQNLLRNLLLSVKTKVYVIEKRNVAQRSYVYPIPGSVQVERGFEQPDLVTILCLWQKGWN